MKPADLVAADVHYYSSGDEDAFFQWLRSIPCITDFKGAGRELFISLSREPNDDELRELIALVYRYGVDMRQLASFLTSSNQKWLQDRKSYWFQRVFG